MQQREPIVITYDPEIAPDPSEWLALGEQERIDLGIAFHEAAGIILPDVRIHAAIHCAVETQIAEDFKPAIEAMRRLKREGLCRHDALHAVGTVLAGHLFHLMKSRSEGDRATDNAAYATKLARLTAKWWIKHYRRKP
jgi:hypothetical protein